MLSAAGKIRSAIGKAHLLTNKKFAQFRELCNKNLASTISVVYYFVVFIVCRSS